ncbi:hypothetical protein ZIOFF_010425 [Zingiber officinale]|uniref:Uncharacterized protein n=1 Tax=Zingiber officinale TaxID=94328 RepID=A0A8J5LZH7_ZINOF|nr:hypothetical protein ZIOFF_010425 [Zingiber officinale]
MEPHLECFWCSRIVVGGRLMLKCYDDDRDMGCRLNRVSRLCAEEHQEITRSRQCKVSNEKYETKSVGAVDGNMATSTLRSRATSCKPTVSLSKNASCSSTMLPARPAQTRMDSPVPPAN